MCVHQRVSCCPQYPANMKHCIASLFEKLNILTHYALIAKMPPHMKMLEFNEHVIIIPQILRNEKV